MRKSRSLPKVHRAAAQRLALEPRIVFDAAAAAMTADTLEKSTDQGAPAAQAAETEPVADVPAFHPAQGQQDAQDPDAGPSVEPAPAPSGTSREIIFVDAAVQDVQPYLHGRTAEVVVLDASRDGMEQIAEALEGRSDITAIHILSHGSEGQLRLGTAVLDTGSMDRYADELQAIQGALAEGGDLLVYGCDVGAGQAGQAFVEALSQATGADVSASVDDTGAQALGGNWVLENSLGTVETLSVSASDWNGLLDATAANGSGALLGVSGRNIYSIDITTGKATLITTVPATVGGITVSATINSLAVDQANGLIYYMDSNAVNTNVALFAYDYATAGLTDAQRHIVIDSNLTNNGAGASIAVGATGVGSGAATFANGTLYLGIENNGVQAGTGVTSDDTIYRITFSGGGRTVSSVATFLSPVTGTNDWGDLGYHSATNTLVSITTAAVTRYNATTGAVLGTLAVNNTNSQAGESAGGATYRLADTIQQYNPSTGAVTGSAIQITTNGTTALATLSDAAGWVPATGTIGDKVFDDNNTNGVFDAGDTGVAGVTVQLIDDVDNDGVVDAGERVLATDTTNANGDYLFTNVLPGNYIVRVTDTGNVLGSAASTTGGATNGSADITRIGGSALGIDFGVNNRAPNSAFGLQLGTVEDTNLVITGSSVSDADGNLATVQLSVTNGGVSVSLGGGATISAGANGSSTLTLSGTSAQINAALGSITYTPTADFNGVAVLTLVATDKAGVSDTNTLNLGVSAVNDTNNDNGTTAEDTPVTLDVLANDNFENPGRAVTAVNGQALVAGGPAVAVNDGTVALDTSGRLVFTPAANSTGTAAFTYTVTSGGATENGNVFVNVTAVNDAPANSVPPSVSGSEDTPLAIGSVSVGDVDSMMLTTTVSVTNGTLTVATILLGASVSGNGTSGVTLSGTAGQINAALAGLTYTGTTDYNGPATLTVVTIDGAGGSDTDTVAITVAPVADIQDDSATTAEDTPVTIAVLANDSFESAGRAITAVNGQAITASGAAVAVANGMVSLNAGGQLVFTPAANYNGPATFTYTVTSGGVTETANVNVTVTAVNDAPVNTVPGSQTANEDTALAIAGLSVADVDGAGVNLTTTVSVSNGTVSVANANGASINGNGTGSLILSGTAAQINAALAGLSYTNAPDYNGSATLTVVTSDGAGSDTDTVAITVAPVADIQDDSATTAEDTAVTIAVLANDSFEDAGRTITAVNGQAITAGGAAVAVVNGTVSLNTSGQLVFTPAANYNGPAAFTYTVTSGGVTETADVNVTVTAVNDVPVNTVPGAQTASEDTAKAISGVSVADVDGAGVNLTTTVSVSHGTVSVASANGASLSGNGTASLTLSGTSAQINAALAGLSYLNTADYNGPATLTVVTSDGAGSDTDTVAITVAPVADIRDDSATTAEDTAVTIGALGNDSFENAGRTITAVNGQAITAGGAAVNVTNGSVTLNAGGQLVFTPALNYNGPASFSYTVTSGGVTETANVNITVTARNDAPVNTVPGGQTATEDTPLAIAGISVADVDGAGVNLTTTVSVSNGAVSVANANGASLTGNGTGSLILSGTAAQINAALAGLSYTNTADYHGAATLTVVTNDGAGGSDTDTVAITVAPVADIADDSATTAEDTAVTISVLANDSFESAGRAITAVNGQAITAGGTAVNVTDGAVSLTAGGQLVFTPAANYNGTASFSYTVSSGGVIETASVTVTVTAVNDAPANTVPGAQSMNEDAPLAIAGISVADVDGAGVNLTTTVSVSNGTVSVANANGASLTGNGTGSLILSGTAAQINAALAGLSYTNTADYHGAATLTVVTNDGAGGSDTDTVAVTVAPVADIADDSASTAEDTAVTIGVLANDSFENAGRAITAVNGQAITAGGAAVAVTNGTVSLNAGGQLVFTPALNYTGPATFTYTVTSGGVTETANVNVTVTAVNDAPVNTVPGAQSTNEDTPLAIAGISVADVDGAGVNLTTTVSVSNGTVSVSAGGGAVIADNGTASVTLSGTAAQINAALAGLSYANSVDYNGVATLTVVTSDGAGGSDTDTVAITVAPVADIQDDSASTTEDTAVTIGVLANDSFENTGRTITAVNGQAITVGGPAVNVGNGSVSLNAGGQLIFTPALNYNGPASFSYTVSSAGTIETANVNVTVTAVNDAPVNTVPGAQSTNEDTPVAIAGISVADVDGAGVNLTTTVSVSNGAVSVTNAGGASLTGNGTGSLILSGTAAQINAALAGLSYTNTADYNGAATLTVVTSDDAGGGDTDTVAITVAPVTDIADDSATTAEDTPVTIAVLANDSFENAGRTITAVNGQAITAGGAAVAVANGTVSLNAGGQLVFTPAANYTGPAAFTYTVTSGGVTETANVDVTVTAVNDAPTGTDSTVTISEDTSYTLTVADFGFADPADAPAADAFAGIWISDLPAASQGVYTLNGAPVRVGDFVSAAAINGGQLVYTPAVNANGNALGRLGFQVRDDGGTAAGGQENDPTANYLTFSITPADDTLTIGGLADGPAGADAQVRESDLATGSTPGGTGERASGSFVLGPADKLGSLTLNGTTISVAQLSASAGAPITVSGSNGTLTLCGYDGATGRVSYSYTLTTAADHSGNATARDTFTIVATDVDGDVYAPATLGIDIVDDAPAPVADVDDVTNTAGNPSSVASGNVVTGTGGTDPNTTDGNRDTLGADGAPVAVVTGVAAGTGAVSAGGVGGSVPGAYGALVLQADGSYTYTPDYNNTAVQALVGGRSLSDTFTYEVTDGDGDRATTTLTVNIVGVPAVVGLGDGAVAGSDGSVLESDLNLGGTNAAGNGEVFTGNFQILTIAGTSIDELRVGGSTVSGAQLATLNTTPVTVVGGGVGAAGTLQLISFDASTGVVGYRYELNTAVASAADVTASFAVSVKDSLGNDTATASPRNLNIAIVDDRPEAVADTASAVEDGINPVTGNVLPNDLLGADGAAAAGAVTAVAAGSAVLAGGVGAPVAGSYGRLTLQADGNYSYELDNTLDAVNRLQAGQTLTETFTYTITDGDGDTSTVTLTITIDGSNDAPVAGADSVTTTEDTSLELDAATLLANDTDAEGGLSILSVQDAVGGSVSLVGGMAVFVPAADFSGTGSFSYTVKDGQGLTSTANVAVTVIAVNDAPVNTVPGAQSTNEDTPLAIAGISVADVDGAGVSLTTTVSVSNGTVSVGAGGGAVITDNGTASVTLSGTAAQINAALAGLSYSNNADYNGAATLTVVTSDGAGGSDTDTVAITVAPVADIQDDSASTAEDTAVAISVLANDSFENAGRTITAVNGQAITVGGPAVNVGNGSVSLNADGELLFTPAANYNGPASFNYTVSSGGTAETANVSVTVTAVNDAPANTVPGAQSTSEDTPLAIPGISVADADGAGVNLTTTVSVSNGVVSVSAGGGAVITNNGTASITLTGTAGQINAALASLSYTNTADYNGAATLTVVTSDGAGGSDTDTVAITVAPVADIADDSATMAEDTAVTISVLANDSFENAGRAITAVNGQAITAGGAAVAVTNGTVNLNAGGQLVFTPALNYTGPATFTYTVTSGGVTETANVNVTVTAVNDAPVNTVPGAQSTNEDTPLAIAGISVADVDGAGVNLTTTVSVSNGAVSVANANGASLTGNGTGSLVLSGTAAQINAALAGLSYTNAADYNGAATLTVVTSDGVGGSDTDTVAITVAPVVDIQDDSATTAEDTAVTISVLANDSFESAGRAITAVNGQAITAGGAAVAVANGAVSLNTSGQLVFTPGANYNGPAAFTYTVTSGDVTETANVNLTVTAVNDAPVNTVPGSQTANEDTALAIAGISVADVDGAGVNLTTTVSVSNGTVSVANAGDASLSGNGTASLILSGTAAQINAALAGLSYTNAPDYNGPATLTLVTNDGTGGGDTDTVAITVAPVADIADDSATTAEDTPVTISVLANDSFEDTGRTITAINGQAVTAGAAAVAVSNGTVSLNAQGQLVFTPAANYSGPAAFTYTVTSGGVTETANVNVTVTAVNDAPVNTVPGAQSTNEDTPLAIPGISVADMDGAGVNLTTTVSVSNGVVSVASAGGATLSGNGTGSLILSGTAAQINAALAGLSYTNAADYNGVATLTVVTSDGTGGSDTDTVAITVAPVADIADDSATTAEDTAVTISVLANDSFEDAGRTITAVNGQALTAGGPAVNVGNGSVSLNADGELLFTPAANYNGPATFTYTVTSGGVTETANVNVTVTAVNDAPVNTVPGAQSTSEDTPLAIAGISVADVDGAGVNLTTTVSVSNGTVSVANANGASLTGNGTGSLILSGTAAQINAALAGLSYTNAPDYNGPATLTVVTNDGAGGSDTDTVAITVAPVADIVDDSASTAEDTPVAIDVLANDSFENAGHTITAVNGQALTAGGAAVSVTNGSVSLSAGGQLVFTPAANYNGLVAFTYTVTSGGTTETATVNVTVTAINDAPVNTVPGAQSTDEDTPLAIAGISVADVDGAGVNLTTTVSVSNGAVSVANANGASLTGNGTTSLILSGTAAQINAALAGLSYTNAPDYNGPATLTVVTSDGAGGSDTDTVAIPVAPVADIADDSATTAEDTAVTIAVLANDSFENAGRTITAVNGQAITAGGPAVGVTNGSVSLGADGRLVFTPATHYNGPAAFSYTVTSGGVTETATVSVTVTAVNDAPVNTVPGAQSTNEDTPLAIGGISVSDVDGAGVNLTTTVSVSNGTVSVSAGGGALITHNGTASVTLTGTAGQINAALAGLSYINAPDYNGAATLTVVTSDDAGGSDTDTVAITVAPVADIADDSATTAEDTPVTIDVLADDSFEDAGRTITAVNGQALTAGGPAVAVANGAVSLNAGGQLVFTPAANYTGSAAFTYTVTAGGVNETANVNLIVTSVNDIPVAGNDSAVATTPEDQPVTIPAATLLANDSDADADMLVIASVQDAVGGTVELVGGNVVFTPAPNYNGPASFTYTVIDGRGGSVTAAATLTVTAVNDAPQVGNDLASTPLNTPLANIQVLANDSDADRDTLTVTSAVLQDPAQGTVVVNLNGSLDFTPALNVSGPVLINYVVSDGKGGSTAGTLTVNVGANTPPSGQDRTLTLAEDATLTLTAADFGFSDADAGQEVLANVRIDSTPAAGRLTLGGVNVVQGQLVSADDINAGRLVFVPAADGNGTPYTTFSFSVQDAAGAFDPASNQLELNVTPVNDAPVAVAGDPVGPINEDQAVTIAASVLLANDRDADGDTLSIASVQDAVGGTVNLVNGNVVFTPAADFNGPASFSYTVIDGKGGSATATVNLQVNAVNDAPRVANDLASTPVNTPLAGIDVLANDSDADGDALIVTAALVDPVQGTVSINADGSLNFTPAANFSGMATIRYTVSDGTASTDGTLTVSVGANNAPTGANAALSLPEDGTRALAVADFGFSDPDRGQSLANVRIDTVPAAGQLLLNGTAVMAGKVVSAADIADGRLVFVPAAEGNGAPYASFEFSVQDTAGAYASAPARISFVVAAAEDAPVATDDILAATPEDQAATVSADSLLVNDSDVDGDTLTLASVQGAVGGTVALVDGNVVFTPAANYHGDASFTYTVIDGQGGSATATVRLQVSPVNDLPEVEDDVASTPQNQPLTIDVLANDIDIDGDMLRVTTATVVDPTRASVSINADGSLRFTPASNVSGPVLIDYTVSDGQGGSATGRLTVYVGDNIAPSGTSNTLSLPEDSARTLTVADFGFTDPDPTQALAAVRIDVAPEAGQLLLLDGLPVVAGQVVNAADIAAGRLVFVPAPDGNGAPYASFQFTVQDSGGAFATGRSTMSLNVTAVQDAPLAVDDTVGSTREDQAVTIAASVLLANDRDADGDTLSIASVQDAVGGTVNLVNGNVVFTPAADFNGPASFSYTVIDGKGGSATATVNLQVNAVNDAPRVANDLASTPVNTPLLNIDVLANDSDVDEDTLTVTVTPLDPVTQGTVSVNADGSLNFTPANNVSGPVVIRYTVSDGQGGSTNGTLTVSVGANTAPTGAGATLSLPEDGTRALAVADFGFSDPDSGQSLANVRIDTIPAAGQLLLDGIAITGGQVVSAADIADGRLVFVPAAEGNGAPYAGFDFSVQDTAGAYSSAPARISFAVAAVQDGPVAADDTLPAIQEDQAATIAGAALLANDDDADGDTLTLASVQGAVGGTVALVDGNVVFTPAANYHGDASFTYTLIDGQGGSATATVRLQVSPVNDAPVAGDNVASTPINTPIDVDVLADDTDIDGDTLRVTEATLQDPAQGSVSINADGTLRFTPALDVSGPVVIQYVADDGQGGSTGGTLTVNVGANAAPTGGANTLSLPEDGVLTLAVRDFPFIDPDLGQTLGAVRFDVVPRQGELLLLDGLPVVAGQVVSAADIAAGRLVFVPAADGNGMPYDSFEFTVQDSAGAFAATRSTMTFEVTRVQDAPVAADDTVGSTDEDTPATIAASLLVANDRDADGDVLTLTSVQDAVGGTVVLSGGNVVFTPAAHYQGPASFTYTVSDGQGGSATATVRLQVSSVNDVPQTGADLASTPVNTPLNNIDVLANDGDADGDTLSVTAATVDPAQGTVTRNADGSLNFTPALNFSGTAIIGYTVNDGTTSATGTLTVNVGANTAPSGTGTTLNLPEDGTRALAIADFGFSDPDLGQGLANVRIDTAPAAGQLLLDGVAVTAGQVVSAADIAAGRLVFVPGADGNGAPYAGFDFSVQDTAGAFAGAPARISFNVSAVNDTPVAGADLLAPTQEDQAVTIPAATLLANDSDADGQALTLTSVQNAVGGTVALVGGNVVFTPTADYHGPASFTYTVSDGQGGSTTATVSLAVTAVDDAPVQAVPGAQGVTEDAPRAIAGLRVADADGGNLTTTVSVDSGSVNVPLGGGAAVSGNGTALLTLSGSAAQINAALAGLVYSPVVDRAGAATLTLSTTDSTGLVDTDAVALNIAAVADIRADSVGAVEDTPVVIDVLANDSFEDGGRAITAVNGQAITAGGAPVAVANGSVSLTAGGQLVFAPAANYSGSTSFSYTVGTGSASETASVTVSVASANFVPQVQGEVLGAIPEDGSLTVSSSDLLANDSDGDGDALSIVSVQDAMGGSVRLVGGAVVFTPAPDYNGPAGFRYTVTDGRGGSATATVSFQVSAVNDAPRVAGEVATTGVNQPLGGIAVLANDSDADGDALSVTSAVLDDPALGSVTVSPDGTLSFTPALNASGVVTIRYVVSDGQGGSSTGTLTLVVADDLPEPGDDSPPAVLHQRPGFDRVAVPALHVLFSVGESRSEMELSAGLRAVQADSATQAELLQGLGTDLGFAQGLQFGSRGLAARELAEASSSLFVQRAVRHQSLTPEHSVFVQEVVRASRLESLARGLRADSLNSAAVGATTLFDPFALGTPAAKPAAPARGASEPRSAAAQDREAVRVAQPERGVDTAAVAAQAVAPERQPLPVRRAAEGFASQLSRNAQDFRARLPRAAAADAPPVPAQRQ
ncbi:Ig-like domain-containing protein [Ramlibacter tataouinensis]|uniref:Tandem-95 repeat protein n=1 Tax=Ramlibacter tataouinensis (strain ATCC BAA-407 / DSM 14655 / LMG 21543 / TTB310) TaxID=365046 RepID=F5Y0H6_RAMTT|nr:tandem-95 repeat protein [Ramlibacter tataouinensis]AEG93382.1 Conserved hypothetical protein [Ramlibacter tataouinensis TTB310]